MRKKILDTAMPINHWISSRARRLEDYMEKDAKDWARRLIEIEKTEAIVTPVRLEFLCGVRSSHELTLARAYLDQFQLLDGGRILKDDWDRAVQFACRVPQDTKPRHLGDCLIRAIAVRLNHDVRTPDKRFHR